MQERTILVNGFSKSFAMTGWRLGFLAAPKPLCQQMLKIHQYAIMCAPTVSQYAAITALQTCDDEVQKMVHEYNVRRRMLVDGLNRIGLHCFNPEGAFMYFHAFAVPEWIVKRSVRNCCKRKKWLWFQVMRLEQAEKALFEFPMLILLNI